MWLSGRAATTSAHTHTRQSNHTHVFLDLEEAEVAANEAEDGHDDSCNKVSLGNAAVIVGLGTWAVRAQRTRGRTRRKLDEQRP
jgi:hypothetical protein